MRKISEVEIKANGTSEFESIDQRLKALILTTEGTLPGSRGFGLQPGILDLGPSEATNLLVLDLIEKAEIYVPEVDIADVETTPDGLDRINTRIHIERRQESD